MKGGRNSLCSLWRAACTRHPELPALCRDSVRGLSEMPASPQSAPLPSPPKLFTGDKALCNGQFVSSLGRPSKGGTRADVGARGAGSASEANLVMSSVTQGSVRVQSRARGRRGAWGMAGEEVTIGSCGAPTVTEGWQEAHCPKCHTKGSQWE